VGLELQARSHRSRMPAWLAVEPSVYLEIALVKRPAIWRGRKSAKSPYPWTAAMIQLYQYERKAIQRYGGWANKEGERMMLGFGFFVLLVVGGFALALTLGGAEWLRRTGAHRTSNEQRRSTPRELLDRRLARGEIDQDVYEAIRAQLES